MKKYWTQTVKTGVLVTTILLLSAALFIQAQNQVSRTDITHPRALASWDEASSTESSEMEAFDWTPAYGGSTIDVDEYDSAGSMYSAAEGSASSTAFVKEPDDLENANGLVSALQRIIRSGKKMKILRSTNNPVLERQCVQVMNKLRKEAQDISSRRRNVVLQAGTTSLASIFSNISRCVGCDAKAEKYCELAQKDLDSINRSVSLD